VRVRVCGPPGLRCSKPAVRDQRRRLYVSDDFSARHSDVASLLAACLSDQHDSKWASLPSADAYRAAGKRVRLALVSKTEKASAEYRADQQAMTGPEFIKHFQCFVMLSP
jgi:hypothetical protein